MVRNLLIPRYQQALRTSESHIVKNQISADRNPPYGDDQRTKPISTLAAATSHQGERLSSARGSNRKITVILQKYYKSGKNKSEPPTDLLAAVCGIDTCTYAVMGNHNHAVLPVDANAAATWSEREVVER